MNQDRFRGTNRPNARQLVNIIHQSEIESIRQQHKNSKPHNPQKSQNNILKRKGIQQHQENEQHVKLQTEDLNDNYSDMDVSDDEDNDYDDSKINKNSRNTKKQKTYNPKKRLKKIEDSTIREYKTALDLKEKSREELIKLKLQRKEYEEFILQKREKRKQESLGKAYYDNLQTLAEKKQKENEEIKE